jgi:two-component system, NtrC family, nitrogen regulation sensor histidine kinase GlnL
MAESDKIEQPPAPEPEPTVVYRRRESIGDESPGVQPQSPARAALREIAPTVTPLIIGFTLLLIVIFVLGYRSIHLMDDVGFQVLDLEHQHAARANLLLQLRLALTKLDNEARARQEAEAGRGLKPPFDFRLRTAREEMNKLIPQLERPPLSNEPKWNQFRGDLESYVEVTENLRRYSLEGYPKFRTVDGELNDLFAGSTQEQEDIFQRSAAIQQRAARTIRVWSLVALLAGFLVAAGTVWEVQRRFRQMRRSMNEARRERSFSNQMLEGMVSAVVAIDQDDRIRSANRAFFEIFPQASIGAFVREKFADEDRMKMLEVASASRVQEATYCGRWTCQGTSPGLEKSYDVYSSPLAIDGDRGQLVTLVDVTEAAESERILRRGEALAAVGQATTQVAHEIKNPLGSIRLGVSMLRDNVAGDKEALRTIELVERGVKHLNKLVIDVTQFSRRKPLERTEVDLDDVLNRSLDLLADRIKEKEIPVERIQGQKIMGNWDRDQLVQVFVNIIGNALDASADHGSITIATELISAGGLRLSRGARRAARITISDHGKGIDRANLERIFEPFYSTKKRGTGLGLAIVKQIIDQHDGEIRANSEPGNGAQFTIELPM